MVDTGINRLGLPMADLGDPLVGALEVDTLMSHLASADENVAQNAEQLARFEQVQVQARHRSLANSAGIGLGPGYAFDLTRPGLALYGGVPRAELAGEIRQVAHPQAAVLQVRELSPGDSVGYNAKFTADRTLRVATASLGYADGFLRCWSGRAHCSMAMRCCRCSAACQWIWWWSIAPRRLTSARATGSTCPTACPRRRPNAACRNTSCSQRWESDSGAGFDTLLLHCT
jgi:alanine racemase